MNKNMYAWKWSKTSEFEAFEKTYEKVRKDLTTGKDPNLRDAVEWYDNILQNLMKQEKSRGFTVVKAYECFAKKEDLNEKNIEISRVLGCCIEMVHTYFGRLDEIRQRSIKENLPASWFLKVENIAALGVNDDSIYELIKIYCSKHPYFRDIVDVYLTALMNTQYGVSISYCNLTNNGRPNFTKFGPEDYEAFVKYRLSYYTFDLPVRAALFLAKFNDEELHKEAERILIRIGYLFQAQNDFINCFANEDITGANNDDIREGNCTWVAAEAYPKMNSTQKKVFEDNYGRNDDAAVIKVLNVFEELDLKNVFKKFEEKEFNEIRKLVAELGNKFGVNIEIFHQFLQKVFNENSVDINQNTVDIKL